MSRLQQRENPHAFFLVRGKNRCARQAGEREPGARQVVRSLGVGTRRQ